MEQVHYFALSNIAEGPATGSHPITEIPTPRFVAGGRTTTSEIVSKWTSTTIISATDDYCPTCEVIPVLPVLLEHDRTRILLKGPGVGCSN